MIKKRNDFWEDKNGNLWSMCFYTRKEAEAASKTLTNCKKCIDCRDCESCEVE